MKISVFIAVSVDGFIARTNGDLDWLPGSDGPTADDGEDYGYGSFISSVDVLVVGRHSFEKVLSFLKWPYKDKFVVVLSRKPVNIPDHLKKTVDWKCCSPSDLVKQLSDEGFSHIYVDGGKTIQGFLSGGIVQQLILTTVPILIGRGIPLFGSVAQDIRLQHIETKSFSSGFVQTRYNVLNYRE